MGLVAVICTSLINPEMLCTACFTSLLQKLDKCSKNVLLQVSVRAEERHELPVCTIVCLLVKRLPEELKKN